MRTTITLTPEADSLVRRVMRERGLSFKEAVNEAILASVRQTPAADYRTPTFDLGARVSLDDIGGVLGRLDDEEFLRKQEQGK